MKLTNGKIIAVAIAVTIIHFFVTAIVGHYMALQIGSQMGQIISSSLITASQSKSEEEAARIYQNMKIKNDDIYKKWEIANLIISLPARPALAPLLKEIRRGQMEKVLAHELTKDQFQRHALMLGYGTTFLNSLSIGVIIFILLKLRQKYKRKT